MSQATPIFDLQPIEEVSMPMTREITQPTIIPGVQQTYHANGVSSFDASSRGEQIDIRM